MASVIGMAGDSVDYSIVTGEPSEFIWDMETIYSREEGISKEGWQKRLVEFVVKYDLNKESPRFGGKHAFIYWMEEQGLL